MRFIDTADDDSNMLASMFKGDADQAFGAEQAQKLLVGYGAALSGEISKGIDDFIGNDGSSCQTGAGFDRNFDPVQQAVC